MSNSSKISNNILFKDTLLAMAQNSVGSKTWQNFYIKENGRAKDIMRGGEVSCAFFVSSLLHSLELLKTAHATVDSTVKDLLESGWKEISKPRSGAVILWESKVVNGTSNRHLGICLTKDKAISNSSSTKKIAQHHITFGAKGTKNYRAIEKIYWREKIN